MEEGSAVSLHSNFHRNEKQFLLTKSLESYLDLSLTSAAGEERVQRTPGGGDGREWPVV